MTAPWKNREASPNTVVLRSRSMLSQVMRWDPALTNDLAERLWDDPDGMLADGQVLQNKPRCTVVRLDTACGRYVLKRHQWGGFGRTLRRSLSQSTAKKCWLEGRFLHAAGIPTQRPWAYIDRRIGPFKHCSYVLTDYIPGTSLYRYLRCENPSAQQIRQLAQQVARIWQQLDDLRVQHNDFKSENFLLDPHGKLWLIDLERMRRCRSTRQTRARQMRDLGALFHPRNWRANPDAAEVFRQEFLRLPAIQESIEAVGGKPHPLKRPFISSNQASQLVTVLIPCHNSASTITTCLESVRDFADEILVVDGGSQDETVRVVRDFGGCRIIERSRLRFAELAAVGHELASHEWILRLEADEQCNPELSKHIQDVLAREPAHDGFYICREICFGGHRLRFGGVKREWSVRLYRKTSSRSEARDGRLKVVIPSGKIGRLIFPIEYESCSGVFDSLAAVLRESMAVAESEALLGRRPRISRILCNAPWSFFTSYILRGGFFDGWPGLHASAVAALAIYLREGMLWDQRQGDLSRVTSHEDTEPAVIEFARRSAA